MQKSEAVAIRMSEILSGVEILFPKKININEFSQRLAYIPFKSEIVEYLDALSKELYNDSRLRLYPDVATFAFFCRRGNILALKKEHASGDEFRLGKGIVFHIAPSNVAVNFAYSLVSSLLAGNLNLVRVPSKRFDQIDIIVDAIYRLSRFSKHEFISSRIALFRYDRQSSATGYFSSICDARVVWGGDETIAKVRDNKLLARSSDITFSDRYSLCAINADELIKEKSIKTVVQGFYNDTYLFDQNACTAPHLVIWLGTKKNVVKAKSIFWDSLYEFARERYTIQPVIAVDKLTSFYHQSIHLDGLKHTKTPDNLIWRVSLKELKNNVTEFRCSSGYFAEYRAESLIEISSIIDRRYQTLSYYGISRVELNKFISDNTPKGIDRIVPIGKTSDFSLKWDGIDLIRALSRIIDIK